MKPNLKDFPIECCRECDDCKRYHEWKEGFEKELREMQQTFDPKKCYMLCLDYCPILNLIFDEGLGDAEV